MVCFGTLHTTGLKEAKLIETVSILSLFTLDPLSTHPRTAVSFKNSMSAFLLRRLGSLYTSWDTAWGH